MDSDSLDTADVTQDGSDPESPIAAAPEASPPAAPVLADAVVAEPLDDTPDEDETETDDGPEPVVLTRAQYDRLLAAEQDRAKVQQEKLQMAQEKSEAERKAKREGAWAEWQHNRGYWQAVSDNDELDRPTRTNARRNANEWDAYYLGKLEEIHAEEIEERNAILYYATRPILIADLVKNNSLTASQEKRVKDMMARDPNGAMTAAMIFGEQNAEKVRDKVKTLKATKKVVADTTKAHLDKQSAARRTAGADTLGGRGAPSAALPFNVGSDEHLMALRPELFGKRR